ncbi:MAG: hypothetical protein RL375_386 [Pseudomonadota bacterium]|jgi:uncharacterized membrane protein
MTLLLLGLILFLGVHCTRIVADPWRAAMLARLGEGGWKGAYSLLSAAGLTLIVIGYGQARLAPVDLWMPPLWTRHAAAALTLPALVLLVAAYVPGNSIKARLGHPMVLGTKVWALAHLLANGRLSDVLLFGGFLLWSVLAFRSARARDRAAGLVRPAGRTVPTGIAVVVGVVAWAMLGMFLHLPLFGVRPFS